MMPLLKALDRRLGALERAAVLPLAFVGVVLVGALDYLGGYEVAFSVFYLGPVAMAAWYSGRRAGILIAVASCASWYAADVGAGHVYSHPAIPMWNALVRLGFFLVTGLLLAALRASLDFQRHLARTDGLTGLYVRRAFEERLQHDLALAERRRSAISLAFIDLDDFKSINDRGGHGEGDRVLRVIGRALQRSVREADTAARLGGDEFALLLPDADDDGAQKVVGKVRAGLRDGLKAEGVEAVTCSIGVVTFRQPPASLEEATAAADALMYEVKRQGKGAVAVRVVGTLDPPAAAAPSRQAADAGSA
jgi:diguanylate cyclase (GGDEF)-like protein